MEGWPQGRLRSRAMFSSLSPLSSCCCCGVCTGTSFVAIIHFLACVAVVETYGSVWSPEGLLLVTMFALMGVPVTFAAMLGAWLKLESYVRAYLIYFLASFVSAWRYALQELTQLHRLLRCARRCVGPCGRVRLQHAAEGVRHAPVVVTSSCAQVLKFWAVQPQHHILKLIVDSAQDVL
eukprot:g6072.t1